MSLLEEHGKTQEKLRTRLCLWTPLFNPKVLGPLQKGGLLREEHPPVQGHPGFHGARSEVSGLF